MGWGIKKPLITNEPVMSEMKKVIEDDFEEDYDAQQRNLQEQLNNIEAKKIQAKRVEQIKKSEPKIEESKNQAPMISKEELDDIIQGHVVRLAQLVEFRRTF